MIIQGPLGDFQIPDSPPETSRICAGLSRGVWGVTGGYDRVIASPVEYDHSDLPVLCDSILDIGAGWGAYAVWARKKYPTASIHCFEPAKDCIEYLQMNAPFAVIYPCAVTVSPDAFLSNGEDWGARNTRGRSGINVRVMHPKDLPKANGIKCDAEGVEVEVFGNYPHLSDVDWAVYEWHTPGDRAELQRICADAGLVCLDDRGGPWGDGNGTAIWSQKR
jgi:FkbM family methyltransferase